MVCEHQAWVRGYLRSRLTDWTAADDLAQDVFVTAYAKMRDFRGDSGVASWLRGIAHNHLRNFIRKNRETAIGGSEELQALLENGGEAWNGEHEIPARLDALAECLRRLPDHAKALLDQRYVAGRSVREMADISGKEYSALAMQLRRMREMLAECITKEMERGSRT
ncbi:MAG: sigma-70 family RNA polymerase sigma factor [Luteolibacter sp.]|jgi:RNA polymerase sigma-70 factor, ECF subfamily